MHERSSVRTEMQRKVRNQIVSSLILLDNCKICGNLSPNQIKNIRSICIHAHYMTTWCCILPPNLRIGTVDEQAPPLPKDSRKNVSLVMFHRPALLAGRQLGWNDREDSKTCTQVDLAEWWRWITDDYEDYCIARIRCYRSLPQQNSPSPLIRCLIEFNPPPWRNVKETVYSVKSCEVRRLAMCQDPIAVQLF